MAHMELKPRVPFTAEGGAPRPGESTGVQAHWARAPEFWGFLHLLQPPHFVGAFWGVFGSLRAAVSPAEPGLCDLLLQGS